MTVARSTAPSADSGASTELIERLRFESLVIELAAGLINLEPDQDDTAIEACLGRIVEALDIDRSTLFQRTDDGEEMTVTHSWARPGFEAFPRMFARASLPFGFERVAVLGKRVVFSSVDDLPEDAATEKAVLRRFGPKSNVTLPLRIGDDIFGALCFGSMRKERSWSPELLDRLGSVANLVAGVLARRRTDGELRAALEEIGRLRERLEQENAYLRQEVRQAGGSGRIVGQSAPLRRVLGLVERVAPTDAPVLITGETGVGKELVADAIHAGSPRAGHVMVKLNCAALPSTLVEAELFGREKGAYTGALTRQIGRFELADHGTLLLDEVSELPLDLQAKLLRVLQEGRFERLGSSQTIRSDVRIIAATNRDLERAVADGRFRADLYFRLRVRRHARALRRVDGERRSVAQDDRALDDVAQLAHVAGPRVALEVREALGGDVRDSLAHLPADLVDERAHQRRDVLGPLAQWGHGDGKHRQVSRSRTSSGVTSRRSSNRPGGAYGAPGARPRSSGCRRRPSRRGWRNSASAARPEGSQRPYDGAPSTSCITPARSRSARRPPARAPVVAPPHRRR